MTGLAATISELGELWPALADALARDTATERSTAGNTWIAATVVNADVLAAMLTLTRDIPDITRYACDAVGEAWQPRDVPACLTQIPRLGDRMRDLAMTTAEHTLGHYAERWLRTVKRALGLRKPDLTIGYDCPYAAASPDEHTAERRLFSAGDEGFLRPAPGGLTVEWAYTSVIYCASPDCERSWPLAEWPHLGRLLQTAATATMAAS